MVGFGYSLVLVYVFFVHSRLMEMLIPGVRIQLALAAGALFLVLLSGTYARAFTTRVGICLVLLTFWFCFGVPFSAHPVGAFNNVVGPWLKNLALFIMVASLTSTRRQCTRLAIALALGSTVTAMASMAMGQSGPAQRLALEDSSLNDPNTLGLTMLMGLPLWMVVIGDRSRLPFSRLGAALCCVPIIVALPLTGSRGTVVGAAIVGLYLFKRFSAAGKAGLIAIGVLVVTLGSTFLADNLLDRFRTITDTEHLSEVESRESRIYLFKQGLRLTVRNPLTGVGLGEFPHAENTFARSEGALRGAWHTSHNMFIQVASEGGIPALIFYWVMLATAWKALGRLETVTLEDHPSARQIRRLALWVRATFLAYCACGLFLSNAFYPVLLTLVALSACLSKSVLGEINQYEEEKAAQAENEPAEVLEVGSLAAPVRGLRSGA